jgi:hypothetical protein
LLLEAKKYRERSVTVANYRAVIFYIYLII